MNIMMMDGRTKFNEQELEEDKKRFQTRLN
jgi:hypothetical protein